MADIIKSAHNDAVATFMDLLTIGKGSRLEISQVYERTAIKIAKILIGNSYLPRGCEI